MGILNTYQTLSVEICERYRKLAYLNLDIDAKSLDILLDLEKACELLKFEITSCLENPSSDQELVLKV